MNRPAKAVQEPVPQMSDEDIFEEEYNRRAGIDPDPAAQADPDPDPAAQADPDPDPDPAAQADPDPAAAPMPLAAQADPLPPAGTPPIGSETPPAQPVVEEQRPEWYDKLDDVAKAAFDELNGSLTDVRSQYTALHGRLVPMQQLNERLRQEAEHAGQRPPAQPPNSSATASQPGPASPGAQPTPSLDLSDVPEFAEFAEAFPEQAKAIKALFGRQAQHSADLQQQLGSVSEGLREVQQASFGQKREQGLERLAAAHPDWMQLRPSQDFAVWLQTQPASVAEMADSPNADECIYVLDRYKQDAWAKQQLANPGTPSPAPSPTQTVRVRRNLIRSAPGVEPQGGDVGHPTGNPDQFMSDEDIWEEEVKRRLRTQRNNR